MSAAIQTNLQSFSIDAHLLGQLTDFLRSNCDIHCVYTSSLVANLTSELAVYREEEVRKYPSVFVVDGEDKLKALVAFSERMILGRIPSTDAAKIILKHTACVAVGGWAVYIKKDSDLVPSFEFGIFRARLHSFATPAEDGMKELGCGVVLIRNAGSQMVQLKSPREQSLEARFSMSSSASTGHLSKFVERACQDVPADGRSEFETYLERTLGDSLLRAHGSLLAARKNVRRERPETLKDGIWFSEPVRLYEAFSQAKKNQDASSLARLQAYEQLVDGMTNTDGVSVLGTDGTLLGYRLFLRPTNDEIDSIPHRGGGRHRTFAVMSMRLGDEFSGAFIRSQDGATDSRG